MPRRAFTLVELLVVVSIIQCTPSPPDSGVAEARELRGFGWSTAVGPV